jgi:hypothetical protein
MEIFIGYNVGALLVLMFVAALTIGVSYSLTEEIIKSNQKEKGDDPAFEARCERICARVCTTLIAVSVVFAGWCVKDNYNDRAITKIREAVEVDLADVIDAAARRSFDQRCQFNGHLVGADWIESDTFPCADFGSIRLWKNSQIVVSKYNAGDSSKIFIGRPQGSDVVKIATFDQNYSHWGLEGRLDWSLFSDEDNKSLESITAAVRGTLSHKAE